MVAVWANDLFPSVSKTVNHTLHTNWTDSAALYSLFIDAVEGISLNQGRSVVDQVRTLNLSK